MPAGMVCCLYTLLPLKQPALYTNNYNDRNKLNILLNLCREKKGEIKFGKWFSCSFPVAVTIDRFFPIVFEVLFLVAPSILENRNLKSDSSHDVVQSSKSSPRAPLE